MAGLMDLTGVDTLMIVSRDARDGLAQFTRDMREMWPSALITLMDSKSCAQIASFGNAADFPMKGEMTFARDARMDDHWELEGYSAMSDGAGPFAIFYECRKNLSLGVNVVRTSGEATEGFSSWEDTDLLLLEATAVTLVSHGAPDQDSFSSSIWNMLRNRMAGG
ncbi:hypothetical protein [Micromonospora sp. IBSANI012]|uniref:hypothetical protein n=1 Tax=Micromonospora sp. IBSANI012 TaxID=3457761 RepID=UPI004059AC35